MGKFLDYTTGDSAVWCRVLFTIDRLVAVLVPLYVGRACGRPMSARIYVAVACVAAVTKNAHVLATRGAEYDTLPVCSNGTLQYETVLVDVCGYPNEQYRVSCKQCQQGIFLTGIKLTLYSPTLKLLHYTLQTYLTIFSLLHLGTDALSPERHSARM